MTTGIKLVKGLEKDNALYIDRKMGNTRKRYFPSDISEYGFNDKTVYKSFSILIDGKEQRRFLLQLFSGEVSIYMLSDKRGNRFFASNQLTPIREVFIEELESFLEDYVGDCGIARKKIPFVRFNRYDLQRFFEDLDTCSEGPIPFLNFTTFTGAQLSILSSSSEGIFTSLGGNANAGFHLGGNARIAIRASNFSIVPELTIQSIRGKNVFQVSNTEYDLLIDEMRLDMPVLLRYTFWGKPGNTFLEFGPISSLQVRNNTKLYSYREIDDEIFISLIEKGSTSKSQLGYVVNVGMSIQTSKGYVCFGRLGYRKLYSSSSDFEVVNVSQWRISIGLQL